MFRQREGARPTYILWVLLQLLLWLCDIYPQPKYFSRRRSVSLITLETIWKSLTMEIDLWYMLGLSEATETASQSELNMSLMFLDLIILIFCLSLSRCRVYWKYKLLPPPLVMSTYPLPTSAVFKSVKHKSSWTSVCQKLIE